MNFTGCTLKYVKHPHNDTNTKYGIRVEFTDDTVWFVPTDPANTDYAEIMRQVDAGELTIEEAE